MESSGPTGLFNSLKNAFPSLLRRQVEKARELTARSPLEPLNHCRLADALAAMKNWRAAIAEYRTAMALGPESPEVRASLARACLAAGLSEFAASAGEGAAGAGGKALKRQGSALPRKIREAREIPLLDMDHNRYFRFRTLAEHILSLYPGHDMSVLDVGGGDGALSLFMPSASYVLAEPSVNGISGADLPFAEKSFDVVVACHVLEHVPGKDRIRFLDMLASRAEKHVLLLNPFSQPDGDERERLNLVVELTGALWAKEHLACPLPALEEVQRYASKRGLGFRAWPNGNLYTSLAMVFLEYYAGVAGEGSAIKRINAFFNGQYADRLTSADAPAAWLVELDVGMRKM